jgi:hypothetical protein
VCWDVALGRHRGLKATRTLHAAPPLRAAGTPATCFPRREARGGPVPGKRARSTETPCCAAPLSRVGPSFFWSILGYLSAECSSRGLDSSEGPLWWLLQSPSAGTGRQVLFCPVLPAPFVAQVRAATSRAGCLGADYHRWGAAPGLTEHLLSLMFGQMCNLVASFRLGWLTNSTGGLEQSRCRGRGCLL